MNISLRSETPDDIAYIRKLTEEAFHDAPHASHTEHLIIDALRDADALFISLVAEINNTIVGHIAISPASISCGTDGWFALGPISVTLIHQRSGIGSLLVSCALEQLRSENAAGCLLVGNPKFYSRFGFVSTSHLKYPDLPPECLQAIPFKPFTACGVVRFHPAFSVK